MSYFKLKNGDIIVLKHVTGTCSTHVTVSSSYRCSVALSGSEEMDAFKKALENYLNFTCKKCGGNEIREIKQTAEIHYM